MWSFIIIRMNFKPISSWIYHCDTFASQCAFIFCQMVYWPIIPTNNFSHRVYSAILGGRCKYFCEFSCFSDKCYYKIHVLWCAVSCPATRGAVWWILLFCLHLCDRGTGSTTSLFPFVGIMELLFFLGDKWGQWNLSTHERRKDDNCILETFW